MLYPPFVPLFTLPYPLPYPQPLHSPQPPSKRDIKNNLQKYSPFYRQAMHFNGEGVETLFYVAHSNFSSEKALKKLEAFGLFKDKKIVFVEYQGDKRGPVIPAVGDGNVEGALGQPRGNSAHFTVKVKDKDSYTFRELEISADGKCGIASSIVALNEILRGETPLSPEVLSRGDEDVSGPPQNGDTVKSDANNPFDALLKKIYMPKVVKDKEGNEKYENVFTLHHLVGDGLTSESQELQPITGNLSDQLKERVKRLLKETKESDWLEPKHVHEILTTNLNVKRLINQGQLQNISAGNIFSFHAAISATVVAGESLPQHLEDSSAPNADNQTLTRAGLPNEGMELEPDKTLKHEFRIIVLNILHEWIDAERQDFSEINNDNFLESLIKEKLGNQCAQKIKTELGGQITFKSLLAIEEDLSPQVASPTRLHLIPEGSDTNQTEQLEKEREAFEEDLSPQFASSTRLHSIPEGLDTNQTEQLEKEREAFEEDLSPQFASPTRLPSVHEGSDTNQTEQLEKEREAFYSAPCGNDKKVFEKILDIAQKFCQYLSSNKDEYSKNQEILLEDFKQVLENSSRTSLDHEGQIKLASIESLIEKLEEEHLSDFTNELGYRLAIKAHAPAFLFASFLLLYTIGCRLAPAPAQPDGDGPAQPGQAPGLAPHAPAQPVAHAEVGPAPAQGAEGESKTELSEEEMGGILTGLLYRAQGAEGESKTELSEEEMGGILTELFYRAQNAEDEPTVDRKESKSQTPEPPPEEDKNLSGRKTTENSSEGKPKVDWKESKFQTKEPPPTENSSEDDFLGELEKFGVWIYEGGKAFLDKSLNFLTTSILPCSKTFNIQSFCSDKKVGVDKPNSNVSAQTDTPDNNPLKPGIDIFSILESCLGDRDNIR